MSKSSNFNPNWTSLPGDTIVDFLQEKELTLEWFAREMDNSIEFVNRLIRGYILITEEIAQQLENVLGASAEFWIKRDYQYRKDAKRLRRLEEEAWVRELPIKDMIKFGWLDGSKDPVDLCLDYFNVKSIEEWREKYNEEIELTAFRTSPTFKSELGAVAAWVRQGEIQSRSIQCGPWNERLFESKLDEIRSLTRKKAPRDFLPPLIEACAECGVAVAIVPTPTGCRASGATKFISPERALLMLSFRYLSDDHFWFTFFHEAGHLLLHKNKTFFLENTDNRAARTQEEEEANTFAGEILIPYYLQSKLKTLKGNKRDVINFALSAGVSPGIVVGQMQHHGYITRNYLNGFKRRYKWEDIRQNDYPLNEM